MSLEYIYRPERGPRRLFDRLSDSDKAFLEVERITYDFMKPSPLDRLDYVSDMRKDYNVSG